MALDRKSEFPRATVVHDGSEYVVGMPGLGLAFRGPDLVETYARAARAHADARTAGLLPRDARGPGARSAVFALRVAIVTVIVVFAVEGMLSWTMRSLLAPDPLALRSALFHIADELEAMRPETKEQLRSAIERIAVQIRPYLAEVEKAAPTTAAPSGGR
ncbi:MAG TPA: hypothetical protein VLV50_14590 [Stellaceae bacterium]|nr:hypothetical protein [Stellaceae bacterium]